MDREARIARLRTACGCVEASVALVLGVGSFLLFPSYFPHGDTVVTEILIGAAVGLGCAIVGKLVGLALARVKLARLLREASNLAISG